MPGRADRAVAVVIPAYQAAAAIAAVVSRTSRAVPGATVYVVDDGSTDGTQDVGREMGATVLVHPQNRGKGAALTTGIAAALASRIGGVAVPDAQTGFRALSRRVAQAVRPGEQGYDFETAFLLAALAQGLRVRSVPVSTVYEGRSSYFRPWVDTWRQARVFTRYSRAIIFGAR